MDHPQHLEHPTDSLSYGRLARAGGTREPEVKIDSLEESSQELRGCNGGNARGEEMRSAAERTTSVGTAGRGKWILSSTPGVYNTLVIRLFM